MCKVVAVYGSLKQGKYNNCVFPEGSKFLTEAKTSPSFTLLDLGAYPGVIEGGHTEVSVELWEVPDFDNLDSLEGNGSFYTREKKDFFFISEGEKLKTEAWLYLLPYSYLNNNRIISSGVWQ